MGGEICLVLFMGQFFTFSSAAKGLTRRENNPHGAFKGIKVHKKGYFRLGAARYRPIQREIYIRSSIHTIFLVVSCSTAFMGQSFSFVLFFEHALAKTSSQATIWTA